MRFVDDRKFRGNFVLSVEEDTLGAVSAVCLWRSGGEFPTREFPRSGIDGTSSGIPFSKMAFSRNSSEFPYRGGTLGLQGGFLFTGGYCFIYREVPLHCATKKNLTCGFKTRRERALKAAIRGRYEDYRRVGFPFCIAILCTRH